MWSAKIKTSENRKDGPQLGQRNPKVIKPERIENQKGRKSKTGKRVWASEGR